jgi:hypothetical protein
LKSGIAAAPLLLLLAGPVLGQNDQQSRQELARQFGAQCVAEQRRAAPNANVSEDFITRYCNCFGQRLPDVVSLQEMQQATVTGGLTPATQSRLTEVGRACIATIREEDRARQSAPPG